MWFVSKRLRSPRTPSLIASENRKLQIVVRIKALLTNTCIDDVASAKTVARGCFLKRKAACVLAMWLK